MQLELIKRHTSLCYMSEFVKTRTICPSFAMMTSLRRCEWQLFAIIWQFLALNFLTLIEFLKIKH